jgi:hypothetical protein
MLRVGVIPQLGIVSDNLRLGLHEGRSSTELRWPPAKLRVWANFKARRAAISGSS